MLSWQLSGGVGHDVYGRCARTTQVAFALRSVKGHLVAGISVYRGHDAAEDRRVVVESLCHGRQAVGRAGRGRNDRICGCERVVVNIVYYSRQVFGPQERK